MSRRIMVQLAVVAVMLIIAGQGIAVFSSPAAEASVITVYDFADGPMVPENCPGQNCRLRDAIEAAAPGDMIGFAACGQINLNSGELEISKNLTIMGSCITIGIVGNSRVFHVSNNAIFTLDGVTIANANCSGYYGCGIYIEYGTANVSVSTFSNNSAGYGGGIHIDSGTLNVDYSTFSNNSAGNGGGGISSIIGAVNVMHSTFSGNSAIDGGGIYNEFGTVNVTNSTFSGNSATTGGGGILNAGTLSVTNSTFSGNSATTGGGIAHYGSATVKNSIISGGAGNNCSAVTIGGANNLSNDLSCGGGFTYSASINLGPLGNYGGWTQTIPLLSGSSAIDAGNDTTCNTAVGAPNYGAGGFDQRGVTRPQVLHCDIGAFEVIHHNLSISKSGTGSGNVTSNPAGIDCGSDCSEVYAENTTVTLTASATAGSTFAIWDNDCSSCGTNRTCVLTMTAVKDCTAQFDPVNSPASFTARAESPSSSSIVLGWTDTSDNETSFKIYRKIGAGAWTLLATTAANAESYSDTTATGNDSTTSYSYKVKACTAGGCSVCTQAAIVPFKPSGLTAAVVSSTQIDLSWTGNSTNETGFLVYRKSGSCSSADTWTKVRTTGADATSWSDTGLTSGQTYSYKVRAYRKSASPQAYGYSYFTGCSSKTTP